MDFHAGNFRSTVCNHWRTLFPLPRCTYLSSLSYVKFWISVWIQSLVAINWIFSCLIFSLYIYIIIILGLCYHFSLLRRNPSLDRFHWCLSWANLVQVVPRCRLRSSLHLVFGLSRGLNHLRGTQNVALMVHLLSWSLATWPAHRCFDCLMWSMMYVTPVCCRIQVLCLWSRRVMPSIIFSIFLCATGSASIWAVV